MSSGYWPTTVDICNIFSEETVDAGGTVTDIFDDGCRLFIRSTMPEFHEISPGDSVKGGVALRSNEGEIWIHPYILRVVCANGSIRPLAMQSTHIVRQGSGESPRAENDFLRYLRGAIHRCLDKNAIRTGVEEMREARSKGIVSATRLLHTIEFLNASDSTSRLRKIAPMLITEAMNGSEKRIDTRSRHLVLRRYHRDEDPTAFGLMNAVTSVARDSQDPEERWRLEEMGGLIPRLSHPFGKLSRDYARPPRTARKIIHDFPPTHAEKEEPFTPGFGRPALQHVAEWSSRD